MRTRACAASVAAPRACRADTAALAKLLPPPTPAARSRRHVRQVLLNVDTRRSRGFGFVVFADDEGVERCIAASTTTPDGKLRQFLDDKDVEIKRSVPRGAVQQGGGGGGMLAGARAPRAATRARSSQRAPPKCHRKAAQRQSRA